MSGGCVSNGREMVRTMKFVLPLLLLCSFSLAHGQGCPTGQRRDPATLVQIEQVWLRAVEQHDKAALGCILADEFEEASFDGSLIDRSAMLATAAKPSTVHFELSDLHAHVDGNSAYVRGVGGTRSDDGKFHAKNRFTDIFVYRDGRWQCVAGHESHFPEERERPHAESLDARRFPEGLPRGAYASHSSHRLNVHASFDFAWDLNG
jgi:ketosteroid isomerase-like protein